MTKSNLPVPQQEQQSPSTELSVSSQTAMAVQEVQGAILVARKFPRSEENAYGRVLKSCERPSFAEIAKYSYPRGGTQVQGPSINLAREIARCWGNIRYGADIVSDDEDTRTIRCWAWDVESNVRESQDTTFKKLVQRKGQGWIKPDERDLLERTNSIAARGVRNCILHLVPPDLVEDALRAAADTLLQDSGKDPEETKKKVIRAFGRLSINAQEIERYLGHPIMQANAGELAELRSIWKSISDGNSTWSEYCPAAQPPQQPGATMADIISPPTPEPVEVDLAGPSMSAETPAADSGSNSPESTSRRTAKPKPQPREGDY